MTVTERRAKSFAARYREQLVIRAANRATRTLKRPLTPDEHFAIVLAARTFLPARRRRYCECGNRAARNDTRCHECRSDWMTPP